LQVDTLFRALMEEAQLSPACITFVKVMGLIVDVEW
jgi:hypothetical protein